jgi:hypothetical protein
VSSSGGDSRLYDERTPREGTTRDASSLSSHSSNVGPARVACGPGSIAPCSYRSPWGSAGWRLRSGPDRRDGRRAVSPSRRGVPRVNRRSPGSVPAGSRRRRVGHGGGATSATATVRATTSCVRKLGTWTVERAWSPGACPSQRFVTRAGLSLFVVRGFAGAGGGYRRPRERSSEPLLPVGSRRGLGPDWGSLATGAGYRPRRLRTSSSAPPNVPFLPELGSFGERRHRRPARVATLCASRPEVTVRGARGRSSCYPSVYRMDFLGRRFLEPANN